jgi:hypothetical protein
LRMHQDEMFRKFISLDFLVAGASSAFAGDPLYYASKSPSQAACVSQKRRRSDLPGEFTV